MTKTFWQSTPGAGSGSRPSASRGSGITWAIATAVISGVAIWVNRFGVGAWSETGGSLAYTTAKNVVAGIVLAVLVWKVFPTRLRASDLRTHWRGLSAVAVFGGAIPFAMFFEGLAKASSTQAAFLHKTLLLWVAALAVPLLGERIRTTHLAAIGALVGGQIVLAGGVSGIVFGSGELLILGATLLWSVEVIIAKRLLAEVPPGWVGLSRMGGGAVVLVAFGLLTGRGVPVASLGAEQLGWVLLTGVVLAGYVYTWMQALALAQAIDVTAVLVGSVLITSLLDAGPAVLVGSGPGLALIAVGVLVLLLGWRRGALHA
jgi:drug/metabolite transporter (DMT)-like permease